MRKDAFNLCLSTLVLSVFGFFLRWLQNSNAFEADTALPIPGAATSAVFLIFSLAAVLFLLLMNRFYIHRRMELLKTDAALACPGLIHRLVLLLPLCLTVVACLVLMFSADSAPFPFMQRITAALGMLAALALAFVFKLYSSSDAAGIAPIASVIPVLFGCMWMVSAYRVHSENPVLWQYAVEMLSIISLSISFYYIAAFFYERAKPGRALFSCQLSIYLCVCTLADDHSGVERLLFVSLILVMLITQFILIENAGPKSHEAQ